MLPSGALECDRRWALLDGRGRFVNGKNFPNIHLVAASFDLQAGEVTIGARRYGLQHQGAAIAAACLMTEWLEGATVTQSRAFTSGQVAEALDLPEERMHVANVAVAAAKQALDEATRKAGTGRQG